MGLKNKLKVQMEAKRQLMIVSANKYGLTSSETIRYSQELDQLMNVYRQVAQSGEDHTVSVNDVSCMN
ncbi:Spo0E family sporulation regulatory protein-aspartic acid phosphatase [Salipaludibacillus keqinensis]|uniref:Spo0E family sporulation regulatory protein-aspartic acid phosphatase n=1 Tax=Salipaludibacillus keqinensis TaxID=2045207 RepID=A0A323TK51_9BACI|nr:aspartyl-phosphate phosphatase Spo0E family protein [Salipaludibacillus keqinensis]PYZ94027.1 Spo0E family sporulation regulatory protein-aspartic acid phosphatase [Salipaludibacillus keqinensis]